MHLGPANKKPEALFLCYGTFSEVREQASRAFKSRKKTSRLRVPLRELHGLQTHAKLSGLFVPPFDRGIM